MPVQAPSLPLDESAFRRALRTGHGRALQQVQAHGAAGLEDVILEAAVTTPAYDPELDDPTPWVDALIVASQLESRALAAIVDAVVADRRGPPHARFHDRCHRAGLLRAQAERGSEAARHSLYECVLRDPTSSEVTGWQDVIALDGPSGLLFVAGFMGRCLAEDPEFRATEGPIQEFDEIHGEGAALAALETVAATDADVASYLDTLKHPRECERSSHDVSVERMRSLSAAEFIARIRSGPEGRRSVAIPRWAKVADAEAIEEIFEALLEETDPECVRCFLWALGQRGLPRFDERIVDWTRSDDERKRRHALGALATLGHPRIRELALERLEAGDVGEGAIGLLRRNFVRGDFARIEALAWPQPDDHRTHAALSDVLDVADGQASSDAVPALLLCYEHSPCGNCRRRAVDHLLALRALPAWVREEIAFDSDELVRERATAAGP